MNRLLTCPSCKAMLRVPAGATGTRYTCPRCLADVPAPATAAVGAPPAVESAGIQTEPVHPTPVPLPPQEPTVPGRAAECPCCGYAIEPNWAYCPECSTRLREPLPGMDWDTPDRQIRKDARGTSVTLTLLAVLGGVGLFGAAVSAFNQPDPGGFLVLILIVMVLAAVSTGMMYARTTKNPQERGIGRVVKGTLALAGGLMAGSCLITVAVWAFLFVACLVSGGKFL
jgi:hypothetical protein